MPLLLACALASGGTAPSRAQDGWPEEEDDTQLEFNDLPLDDLLVHPGWFKTSFLDLQEDISEAAAAGKRGLIIYFGQKRCAYCKQLLTVNLTQPDIVNYIRKHFDIVPVDIWGVDELTDPLGNVLTEREFAVREDTNFTPSLIFYNTRGERVFRLRGYYPPYQFRAALEYVVESYYNTESFSDYLARAEPNLTFEPGELVDEDFFSPPPYNLDRSHFPSDRPLAVLFEQGDCHACDILHTDPLQDMAVRTLLSDMETIQIDMWSTVPVITPAGKRTTAREWAKDLDLFYTPAMVFFDGDGREIIRLDSVVRGARLRNILRYVNSKGYERYPTYQLWRLHSGF